MGPIGGSGGIARIPDLPSRRIGTGRLFWFAKIAVGFVSERAQSRGDFVKERPPRGRRSFRFRSPWNLTSCCPRGGLGRSGSRATVSQDPDGDYWPSFFGAVAALPGELLPLPSEAPPPSRAISSGVNCRVMLFRSVPSSVLLNSPDPESPQPAIRTPARTATNRRESL